jgi:hypothetical protein
MCGPSSKRVWHYLIVSLVLYLFFRESLVLFEMRTSLLLCGIIV